MKRSNTIIRKRSHHKQILLFLIAVVLPSTVLVMLTWHMIGQQKELDEKRLSDERRRKATEIGQKLLVRLEDIKLHEVSAAASGVKPPNTNEYSSDEIILTSLVEGERLVLPWEANPSNNRLAPDETVFFEKIRCAEQEEFTDKRFDQAGALYLECIEESQKPAEQTYARLLRARVLSKLRQTDESLAEYLKVLAAGPGITDEYDIPFCLYAARNLIGRGHSYDKVMQLIESELNSQSWLSPAETYIIRDLVKEITESSTEDSIKRQTAENYRQKILIIISLQEKILGLQRDFPKLAMMARWAGPKQKAESVWIPYSDELWLVSLAPALASGQRMAIVVRGQSILESIAANVRLTTGTELDGDALEQSFPGLRLAYMTGDGISTASDWGLQRSFYLIALLLVLCVTIFGAYFLYRDVGRELRMAEMRSQFIASVSHELKTPLTAIRIFAETLLMGRTRDSQTKTEYLETIVNESHRLTRLLNNVLDFSKIEKGKRTYLKEPSRMSEIVNAAVQATQYPLKQQDFHLNVQMEEELPDVCVDKDAISQAILNLLSNAMKYSGESRRIDLRVQENAGYVVIEVSDQGIGIEVAQQKRIFEKFYRVPSEQNQRIPGTGLGLALVYHIVEAHDGYVEVRSTPGQGSTFSIYLPLENKR
jgi:signal transduction histidine kinase